MKNIIQNIYSGLQKVHPSEIIVTTIVIGLINYFKAPGDPGFFHTQYNPYFITVLFFAVFYGKIPGFITLVTAVISIMFCYAVTGSAVVESIFALSGSDLLPDLTRFMFITSLLTIILGETRDAIGGKNALLQTRLQENEDRLYKKEQELEALGQVNEEYQDRILGQQSSLISLYSTMVSLNSLDLESIYPNILEAVHKFSGATTCSLWRYHVEQHSLELLQTMGWKEQDKEVSITINDKNTIVGWVARNNAMFSIKMLHKYKNLQEIDMKDTIITVPITLDNQVWGVINIESMPFIKYNLYSEQLIMMISDLVSPVIKNALRFSELARAGEIDHVTGFHSIDEMFTVLKEEFSRARTKKLNLSLVIVELINVDDLLREFNKQDLLRLMNDISQLAIRVSSGHALVFQYKETFQFAAIIPNLDYDGCAMYSLGLIEQNSKEHYLLNNLPVFPEIIIGYSSYRPGHKSENDMAFLAENLITLQKV